MKHAELILKKAPRHPTANGFLQSISINHQWKYQKNFLLRIISIVMIQFYVFLFLFAVSKIFAESNISHTVNRNFFATACNFFLLVLKFSYTLTKERVSCAMTIYDIAKKAGVSASTVSRVVNNKPGIKPETRQKIEELLKEYSYTPNETARGLVNRSSKMIGILITDIRYAHYMDIAFYVERELSQAGYTCLIVNTGTTDESKVEAIHRLAQRQIDGLLMVGSTFQCEAVKLALSKNFPDIPIAMANGYLPLPNVKGVLVDEYNGVMECVKLMQENKHQKIAFIRPNSTPANMNKQKGFLQAMREGQAPECADWIYEAATSLEEGYRVTQQILWEHPDVEGLMFCEDEAAVSGVRALTDAGVKVPQQVNVIGVDNTRYCEICNPKLTALDNMMLEMSMESSRILLESLNGNNPPAKIMLFSRIIQRETT